MIRVLLVLQVDGVEGKPREEFSLGSLHQLPLMFHLVLSLQLRFRRCRRVPVEHVLLAAPVSKAVAVRRGFKVEQLLVALDRQWIGDGHRGDRVVHLVLIAAHVHFQLKLVLHPAVAAFAVEHDAVLNELVADRLRRPHEAVLVLALHEVLRDSRVRVELVFVPSVLLGHEMSLPRADRLTGDATVRALPLLLVLGDDLMQRFLVELLIELVVEFLRDFHQFCRRKQRRDETRGWCGCLVLWNWNHLRRCRRRRDFDGNRLVAFAILDVTFAGDVKLPIIEGLRQISANDTIQVDRLRLDPLPQLIFMFPDIKF